MTGPLPTVPLPPRAAHHPPRARTHRAAHSFSSPFSPTANVLTPPPVAHLADPSTGSATGGKTRRLVQQAGAVRGKKRITDWVQHGVGAVSNTTGDYHAPHAERALDGVVERAQLEKDDFPVLDLPVLDLTAASSPAAPAKPFGITPHPHDSPLLGAPLELNASVAASPALLKDSNARLASSPLAAPAIAAVDNKGQLLPVAPKVDKPSAPAKQRTPLQALSSNSLASSRRASYSPIKTANSKAKAQIKAAEALEKRQPADSPKLERHHTPASPSLDITAAFPSLVALSALDGNIDPVVTLDGDLDGATVDITDGFGLGISLDAHPSANFDPHSPSALDLFDEAFPSPSLSHPAPRAAALPSLAQPESQRKHAQRYQHHRRRSTGLRELELVKRRLSWEPVAALAAESVEEVELPTEEIEEDRFEDAMEDELVASPFPSLSPRSASPSVGLGLGLGIDFAAEEDVHTQHVAKGGLGFGLGISLGHEETIRVEKRGRVEKHTEQMLEELDGAKYDVRHEFLDPEVPALSPILASVPDLARADTPKHISPRRQPRSPPRAKKASGPAAATIGKGGKFLTYELAGVDKSPRKAKAAAALKRIYPRPSQLEVEMAQKVKLLKAKKHERDELSIRPQEDLYYGSPNLSDLPGSFVASPVLPTSFSDYSHTPLPTPPTRFSRIRRAAAGQTQPASLPLYMTSNQLTTMGWANATGTPSVGSSATPTSSEPCPPSSSGLLLVSSPAGTPIVAASPTFSPSLAPSPAFAADETFPTSAPGTPIPDHPLAAAASASSTAATGSTQMSQAMFDAAIASTVLGAVAAIGVLGWLALSLFRRKRLGDEKDFGTSIEDTKRFSEEDEKYAVHHTPSLTDLPRVPAVARLSFAAGGDGSRSASREGSPTPNKTFSSHFDGWIDVSPFSRSPGSTVDHGGYPDEVLRGDGMSPSERRMSVASRRMSMQSAYTAMSRPPSRAANRSSYRSSAGHSLVDSTWSTRPGTAMSSRTSHHGASDCFTADAEAGAPPRLPETIPPRVSGDASTYFVTPPGTPTKQQYAFAKPSSRASLHLQQRDVPSSEPPVPTLPAELRDYPIPPVPSSAPVSRTSTRARSNSRSAGGKASTSSKAALKSALKTMPSLSDAAGAEESPTEAALRKLERRRATIDGGVLADGLQALLFQAQLDSPSKEGRTVRPGDVFVSSTPPVPTASSGKRSSVASAARAVKASASNPALSPSARKVRPQTMPPKIVVSDHPPTPKAASPSAGRQRTSTVDTDILDVRSSMKTMASLPWLAQSPSTTFSCHPRDDVSIVDPEMRYERKHFSTSTFSASASASSGGASPLARQSKDFSSFIAANVAAASKHTPLDSLDIASRRLASEDDLASQSSANELGDEQDGDHDSDEEAALRSQRRRTLLYSVYKQRGVDLASVVPSPAASATNASLATTAASPASSAARTTDSEDSSVDSPTKGRSALMSSFPSPPPVPSAASFGNLAALGEKAARRCSTGTIDVDLDRYEECDIGSTVLQPAPTHEVRQPQAASLLSASSSPSTSATPPPRPPKSPVRLSALLDGAAAFSAPRPAAPAALPPRASSARQPFASVSTNAPRAAPTFPLPKPHIPPPPVRSFAADLQESVNNPADGYDSDTLMSALSLNKPGHSLWSSINGYQESTVSASSSAYGFAPTSPGSTSTVTAIRSDGMYATHPGSIESLEEAAIARASTVQFGHGRASGVPSFSWRGKGMTGPAGGVSESEESVYEESDAETLMWRTRMGAVV
ncbi:hypothetical protein JCM10207_004012 [Rhodosporidiobolus poonsookiae]